METFWHWFDAPVSNGTVLVGVLMIVGVLASIKQAAAHVANALVSISNSVSRVR
jgi:hypothetical protein